MAIVINGSGTVTGLAVGGLPDGTVDSGTIATGTIVDADVANLAASKLTGALPAISGASLTSLTSGNLTGALPAIDGASLTGIAGGISEADQWRLSTDMGVQGGNAFITSNLERVDTDGFGKLGTGMSEASGVFSFPSTGVWEITFNPNINKVSSYSERVSCHIYTTTDNSTWDSAAFSNTYVNSPSATTYTGSMTSFLFDVTNITTHKVKFNISTITYVVVDGNSTNSETNMKFIKLGDT